MSHKLQMYENLRDMLEREVQKIEKKNDIDEQSLDHLFKLTSSLKAVDKCIIREQEYEAEKNGYSMNMNSMQPMASNAAYPMNSNAAYPRYSNRGYNRIYIDGEGVREAMKYHSNDGGRYGGSYDPSPYEQQHEGNSYAVRGRDGDSDGQYNESSHNNHPYNDYSRGGGYSRDEARKKMVQKLETLMDDTMSEKERQAIKDCINRIE